MLELKGIKKIYNTDGIIVEALKGITVSFRDNEFVSILGHSGCGKTTMLNIVGGLDHYTSGDLIINGVSTKQYKDHDWDKYRNDTIGFVFQSYNLIMHQSVLSNVELSLTLSGVSKQERRQRAIDALIKVGLKDQINKKPNQLSGGQMQRVAIARALSCKPEIILADEPTGALDTKTSMQIMEILKEISKDTELTDIFLGQLGFITQNEFLEIVDKYAEHHDEINPISRVDYDAILNTKFTYYPNDSIFVENTNPFTKPMIPYNYVGQIAKDSTLANGKPSSYAHI